MTITYPAFLSKKEIEVLTFLVKDRFLFHSLTPKAVSFTRGFATRENTAFVVHSVK